VGFLEGDRLAGKWNALDDGVNERPVDYLIKI
jgi:hypothetical protein